MESTLIYGFGTKATFDKSEKEIQKNDHVEPKELRKSPRIIVSKTICATKNIAFQDCLYLQQ